MRLDELYPYWTDVHEELIDFLEYSDEARWTIKPAHRNGWNIRQIALHLIQSEHDWIGHIVQGFPRVIFPSSDFPDKAALLDGLRSTRTATEYYVGTLSASGLRAVRSVPPDPATNMPEVNRSIAWILWQIVQQEIFYYGQVVLRMQD